MTNHSTLAQPKSDSEFGIAASLFLTSRYMCVGNCRRTALILSGSNMLEYLHGFKGKQCFGSAPFTNT